MNEFSKMSRKAFTATVVAATISWSIGLSALVAPIAAKAAVSSGTLVKASLPAVYYVGSDMKRYVFPNEKTYKTWYSDFSGVMTITDAELASLAIGGNVTYRPGTLMVKITTDPKVYAVDAHGVLRWVKTEAVAIALYGANWNQQIQDVPDAFFTNYTVGSDINSASDFNRASIQAAATSINVDKNLASGVSGSLSVMLSSGQPAGGTLPKSAQGVNMLKVDVRNGSSSAVVVDSLTLKRSGAGAASDFAYVYVYEGANRLTTGRTINTSTNEATFSGLNHSIAAGGQTSLWFAADIAAAAASGNVNSLSLTSLMVGSLAASGLPLSGPSFNIAGASVGTATVASSGSISAVKAGGLNQKVAEFQVTAPSAEDMDLNSIALYYSGSSSRSNLSNFTLKQGGLTIATASGVSTKDLVTFSLSSPMYMERGASRTFEVYADLAAGARSTENLAFGLDQTTDFRGTGRTYGFGVAVTDSYAQIAVSIEAGRFTTTFNGPAAKDIASNAKDVELFNFTIAAQSNLEVRRTELQVTANVTGNCDLIDDMKIVDTASGAVIAGPVDLSTGSDTDALCESALANGTDVVAFTETWNMASGQSRTFKVTADIASTFPAAGTVKVALGDGGDLFDTDAVRNLDNNTFLTSANNDFVPAVNVTGNTHTVRTPSLTVSAASTPVSQTYIQGTSNAPLLGISLKAGDAGEVRVTSLVMKGYVNEDATGTFLAGTEGSASIVNIVQTAKLMNGATQLGDTKSPTATGVVTFDNLNLTIAAGQTVNLIMSGTLAGSIASVATADVIKFEIADDSDVSAADKDGNSLGNGTTTAPNIIGPDADGINNTTGLTANEGIRMTIALAGSVTVALAPDDSESEVGLLVGGSSNAVLAKYKFTATNEELKLAKARFLVATPNAATTVSLYDGATLVGGPVAVDGSGNADFSNMNFVIPKDASKVLTVKGSLTSVGSSGAVSGSRVTVQLIDSDATGATGTYEVRGTSAGSSTTLTTIGATAEVKASATVTLTSAAGGEITTVNGIPLLEGAGTTGDWDASGTDTADATSLAAAINAHPSLKGVVTATSSVGVVTVTAVHYGTGGNAITLATSGEVVSGNLASGTGNSVTANVKVVHRSKPAVALVALPSSTLTNGDLTVQRFTVSADAAGDVSLSKIVVSISKTGGAADASGTDPIIVATTQSSIRRVGDSSNLNGSTSMVSTDGDAGGSDTATNCEELDTACTLTISFTSEEVIAAGTSRTYDLRVTVNGALASGDSVSANLSSDSAAVSADRTGTAPALALGNVSVNFIWSDFSAAPHTDSVDVGNNNGPDLGSSDYHSGFSVKVLPTDSQTMTK